MSNHETPPQSGWKLRAKPDPDCLKDLNEAAVAALPPLTEAERAIRREALEKAITENQLLRQLGAHRTGANPMMD